MNGSVAAVAAVAAIDSQTASSVDAVSFIVAQALEVQRRRFRFGPLPPPPGTAT